jgi:hypothetical protein
MTEREKFELLLAEYKISEEDYNVLKALIEPEGNIEYALHMIRSSKAFDPTKPDNSVDILNYEFCSNANSIAFFVMHDYQVEQVGKGVIKGSLPYKIIDGEMKFEYTKPVIFFKTSADFIRYFTDLAKYKPLLFQNFLISSAASSVTDSQSLTTRISKANKSFDPSLEGYNKQIEFHL